MKSSRMPLLLVLGMLVLAIGPGPAADGIKKIPLDSVYTTTRQKDTKDALTQVNDFLKPIGTTFAWKRGIFLVNGKDFPAAVKASRPFVLQEGDTKAPEPKAETSTGEQNWVGACLGATGSQPPAYRVLSIEVQGRKVRVIYETLKNKSSTLDYYCYLVWAPLGKLSAAEYALELYDAAAKKITATRKSKVVEP